MMHTKTHITYVTLTLDWLVEQGLTSRTQHSLGHFGDDVFTGQMTQPTVSNSGAGAIGHGGGARDPPLLRMAGHGGTVSRRTFNTIQ